MNPLTKQRACLVLTATLALLFAVAVGSRSAMAHAAFESSDPPANAVLTSPPDQITVRFTEPLEPAQTSAQLLDPAGEAIPDATSAVDQSDPFTLRLTVPADLADGTYVVSWRNVSTADGHPMEGFFAFSIGSATDESAATAGLAQESGGPPYWWITVVKWIAYLGLALVVAAWPHWLLVLQPAFRADDSSFGDLQSGVWRLLTVGVLIFEAGSIAALYNQGWLVDPDGSVPGRIWDVLTETRYGRIWFYRLAALALFVVVSIAAVQRSSKRLRIIAAATGFAIPLTLSLIAHASAQTVGRGAAITNSWLHFSASMIWTGGLAYLVLATHLTRRVNRDAIVGLVPRFSVIAIASWIIMALTGTYTSWLVVGSADAATDTDYGKTLIAKLILLGGALAFAGANVLILAPRLKSGTSKSLNHFSAGVIVESLLVVAALLAVGRMVGLQPARDALSQAQPAAITQALDASDHALTLSIAPGQAGVNTYTLSGAEIPGDPKVEGLIRLTRPGATTSDKELKLTRQPDGSFTGSGAELSLVGDWNLEVIVRQIGSFQWSAHTTAAITAAPVSASSTPVAGWRFDTTGLIGMLAVAAAIGLAAAAWLVGRGRRTSLLATSVGVLLVGIAAMAAGRI